MKTTSLRLPTATYALVLTLLALGATFAGKSEPFVGAYSLNEIEETGDQVALSLIVDITNRSGAEMHNGVVYVLRRTAAPDGEPLAKFEGVSLPHGEMARLQQQVSLSASEYEQLAALPPLPTEIQCSDENGVARVHGLSLRFVPEVPES